MHSAVHAALSPYFIHARLYFRLPAFGKRKIQQVSSAGSLGGVPLHNVTAKDQLGTSLALTPSLHSLQSDVQGSNCSLYPCENALYCLEMMIFY